ncbi:LIM homeobox transcription factor 1-alpha isoform X2 [Halyomorpha halys]|uniref:LIM homeobox transcription factor 1-alpha isoform X2 n=1 Tax=Halyomorpha halys TaxID=286706 RepID=UPI0006D50801|nr:LIM homeobox transcription factor 1-alpha isoform X2 [Halyomorpha halys]
MSPLLESLQPESLRHRDMELCSGCGRLISDRYIMRVGELYYHEQCLVCNLCGTSLHHTCFIRDSKLYCRIDYERVYVKKCLSCGDPIGPSELVMKAAVDSVFHLRCFLCVVCGVRLQKGDQYVVKQGQLFCRPDYEKEVEMFQGYAQGESGLEEGPGGPRSTDGRRGPKRPRTILTTQQRRAFKASFELSPKPCRKVRETLAKDTGLSVRIVQVWFQNQRAKIKKMQKKHRLDQKNNNNGKEMDLEEKSDKLKDDDHSSQGGTQTYLGGDSCSDTEGLAQDYSRVKEERDREEAAFYRNMMAEQQGVIVQQYLAQQEGGGGKCDSGFGYPGSGYESYFLQQGLNPIDRLYSMQNSYFCASGGSPVMDQ